MIQLPSSLLEKCREYGALVVREYAAGHQQKSAALSVQDADKNEVIQTEGKMAECIFAIERGLNPDKDLNWFSRPELNGVDVTTNGVAVDVKQTHPRGRLLIWSVGKAGRLANKEFDVFVLVKCKLSDNGGQSQGWISREEFLAHHKVSLPSGTLIPGTLYLEQSFLRKMNDFPKNRIARQPILTPTTEKRP